MPIIQAHPKICQGSPLASAPHVALAIVGAGACGLIAAITLRELGLECVVLERDAYATGSTALSSGFIPAAGTQVQRAAGVVDSAAQFAQDIHAKAHGHAAADLVQAYTQEIARVLDNLHTRHGIQFELLDGFLYPGHSVRRMHAVPQKTGAALLQQLEQVAQKLGSDIVFNATVRELWVDSAQRITGIGYVRPDGSVERLRCDALILACNGFGGNAKMVQEFLPEMQHALFAGHTGNDGSAIAWGRELNAQLADMAAYQGHGSWAIPQGALISWALMMAGGIQVNAHGERFHDETQGYSEAAVHVLAQPQSLAWNVFDDEILKLARQFPDFCEAEKAGVLKKADNIDSLAKLIGCASEAIQAACLQTMRSVALHVSSVIKKPLKPPYYAIKVTGALFHTQGGLAIDATCRVLHQDGSAFPNLFAAGGAARGVSGHAVWGYLSGNGLLSAVAGGAIAGKNAAKLLQKI